MSSGWIDNCVRFEKESNLLNIYYCLNVLSLFFIISHSVGGADILCSTAC